MFKILKIIASMTLCLALASAANLSNASASKNNGNGWAFGHTDKVKVKNGLTGQYFNKPNLTSLKFTRIDPRISFDWVDGAPGPLPERNSFSVRWTGQIQPRYTDTYTFHVISDDGARLWIGNTLVINDWNSHAATETDGTANLEANKKYDIRLEYYDNKNDACVKLLWSSSSQVKEIVPKERLFSQSDGTVQPPPVNPPPVNPPPVNPPQDDKQPLKVDLSPYFNEDAFSYDSKRNDGNYDGGAFSYSADLFKANPVYDGAQYLTGPIPDGRNNSVKLDGQTIGINQNKYESIRLLGSSTNGNKSGYVRINYADGTYSWFNLVMKDWCTSDKSGQKIVQTFAHRHSSASDQSIDNYIFAYYITPDKTKKMTGITMPDQNDMHVLAMTLLPVKAWSVTGNGLFGEYFNNADLTSPKFNRTDATINFDWGQGAPIPQMESDSFSVRWTGQVEPKYSETYTFYTAADDGVRLWINNTLVINDWSEHSAQEHSGTITLSAGTKYNVRLEYFENLGEASVKLMWSSPGQVKEVIPASQLYH